MDGAPKMFAYPTKTNVPDVNAYLYETGVIEVLSHTMYQLDGFSQVNSPTNPSNQLYNK